MPIGAPGWPLLAACTPSMASARRRWRARRWRRLLPRSTGRWIAAAIRAAPRARWRRSIMRQMKGVKISCIASSILPPGTTMVLARLIQSR
jgi:hypothetical protein